MVRRTKEEAQATRDLILDTAELVFQQRGVMRSSLQDIASAAGLTRGAIYWHFENKADLFNAMMDRATLPLDQMMARLDDPSIENPLAAMRSDLSAAMHSMVHDARMRRVFDIATQKVEYVGDLLPVRERHVGLRRECLAQIESCFVRAQARGLAHLSLPPAQAALGLHSLADGLIYNWMLDPESFDLATLGPQVMGSYLDGVARSVVVA